MKILFLLALIWPIQAEKEGPEIAQEPQWKVDNCILANFTLDILVQLPTENVTVSVPQEAKVLSTSHCGTKDDQDLQVLALGWDFVPKNDSHVNLHRTISISFKRNKTLGYYGVQRFSGNFQMAKWNANNTDYFSNVTVDTFDIPALLFHTPLDQSFTCPKWGSTNLITNLQYTPAPPLPTKLSNSTVDSTTLHFDAFRSANLPNPGFRTAMDCTYEPNDVVPIAVGVALAVLVVVVLVAYVIGRRRNRQRGYQSV